MVSIHGQTENGNCLERPEFYSMIIQRMANWQYSHQPLKVIVPITGLDKTSATDAFQVRSVALFFLLSDIDVLFNLAYIHFLVIGQWLLGLPGSLHNVLWGLHDLRAKSGTEPCSSTHFSRNFIVFWSDGNRSLYLYPLFSRYSWPVRPFLLSQGWKQQKRWDISHLHCVQKRYPHFQNISFYILSESLCNNIGCIHKSAVWLEIFKHFHITYHHYLVHRHHLSEFIYLTRLTSSINTWQRAFLSVLQALRAS